MSNIHTRTGPFRLPVKDKLADGVTDLLLLVQNLYEPPTPCPSLTVHPDPLQSGGL
jgi:hypothetical protein